jgi:myo-inositol 2-dehydrogenase/D-chiro-inositol 1-dehydrogenase
MESPRVNRRELLIGAAASSLALAGKEVKAQDTKPIRIGFVGVGSRGSALLAAVLKISGVEVAAICDLDSANRNRACEAVKAAQGKRPDEPASWSELLARTDITTVVAALPCFLHYPMYKDALAAKKNLYGEKPMCLTVAHADDLVQQSRTAGVVFQVGYQRRFGKQLQESVKMVREGAFGPLFDGRGGRFSSAPYRKPGEWFSFREQSGDWMLEQAVHNWDALNWALGELPVSAFGTGRQDLYKDWDPKRDVSDYYAVTLRYKSELAYSWVHSWIAPPDPAFSSTYEKLIGTKGGIDLATGHIAYRPESGQEKKAFDIAPDSVKDSTLLALQSFFESVRTGKQPVPGVKEGRDATLVGLLVRKAVYEQRVVTMDEVLRA